ncbi:MAG: disulfide bond formation protein B [Sulfurospirillum sp.]|nr:disulfide bond formation protein B [Sulfurospirillum sp.]MBP9613819.1 disulfide bond formation protein B [Sulfurospirillum sp.]
MSTEKNVSSTAWTLLFFAWLVATIATVGSLFFSEVMMFPPCVMCWYQRICMYPLVVILLVGLFPLDTTVTRYAMPLTLIGLFFAIYHNLLYYKILPESVQPCSQGVSCTSDYINWFGFITIQFLSLVAFVMVLILLIIFKRKVK